MKKFDNCFVGAELVDWMTKVRKSLPFFLAHFGCCDGAEPTSSGRKSRAGCTARERGAEIWISGPHLLFDLISHVFWAYAPHDTSLDFT
jgi:hypothetical protein